MNSLKQIVRKARNAGLVSRLHLEARLRPERPYDIREIHNIEVEGEVPATLDEMVVATIKGILVYSKGRWFHCGGELNYGIAIDAQAGFYFLDGKRLKGKKGSEYYAYDQILYKERWDSPTARVVIPYLTRGTHQLDWFDNRLWVTQTYSNGLSQYDSSGKLLQTWFPGGRVRDRKAASYCHFNSVLVSGQGDVWLLAHNETCKNGKLSELYRLCAQDGSIIEIIPTDANSAHNIAFLNGKFVLCDSFGQDLKGRGLRVGSKLVLDTPSEFIRGLAANDKFVAVGSSVIADREKRDNGNGGVYILDREYKQLCKFILHGCGAVREVRFLGLDYCRSAHAMNGFGPSDLAEALSEGV